jgi:hypothetical protein
MGFWPIVYAALGVILLVPLVGQILAGTPTAATPPAAAPLPSGLEAAIASAFDPSSCTTSASAARALPKRLDAAGYGAWTVKSLATSPDQCVSWSLSQLGGSLRTVTLVPTLSPEVRASITAFRQETFADCLTRAQATDTLTARLTSLRLADFIVRTDGPFQVPLDRQKEVIAHFEAGCWMYSTYGWLDERFNFFLSGQDVLASQGR